MSVFTTARNRVERLFDALLDPARRERTMLVVLACYFIVWSLYAAIAKSSQDIHTDPRQIPQLGFTESAVMTRA
jgi:hypothetical protein